MTNITNKLRTLAAGLGVLLVTVATLAATVPGTASASSCQKTYTSTQGDGNGYQYSPTQYVAGSWSGCHDINIAGIRAISWGDSIPGCGTFRIRFYPSSGGSYANSWQRVCSYNSGDLKVLATNVQNGTKYRVESYNLSQYSFYLYD